MINVVVMPKLGLTMEEGRIAEWFKSEGDTVEEGDELFSVETEKLVTNVESEETGILRRIVVEEGETVKCGKTVAIIADADEDISSVEI